MKREGIMSKMPNPESNWCCVVWFGFKDGFPEEDTYDETGLTKRTHGEERQRRVAMLFTHSLSEEICQVFVMENSQKPCCCKAKSATEPTNVCGTVALEGVKIDL